MIMYAARCEEASERDEARTCVGQVSVPPSVGVHSSLLELRVGFANRSRHSRKLRGREASLHLHTSKRRSTLSPRPVRVSARCCQEKKLPQGRPHSASAVTSLSLKAYTHTEWDGRHVPASLPPSLPARAVLLPSSMSSVPIIRTWHPSRGGIHVRRLIFDPM